MSTATKVAVVSQASNINDSIAAINGRICVENRVHHAFTGTGCINLAAASCIAGTISNLELSKQINDKKQKVQINHPSGKVEVVIAMKKNKLESAKMMRNARILMVGDAYF